MDDPTQTVETPTLTPEESQNEIFGTDEPTKTDPTPVKVEPKASPTADEIASAVARGVQEGSRQPEKPREYTPQELDQMFKVWNPTEELITKVLGGGKDAVAALVEMRNGLLAQFDTLTQKRLELLERKILQQMSPALSVAQETSAAKDREEFFKLHEDLREVEPLVQTVFNALKAEGFQAKSVEEAYKTLADRTRKLLPNNNGGSGAGQSSGAQSKRTAQSTNRPASLSSGSQAGGGGNSAPAAPFPGAEVFL